jgi:hypothetical protein
VTALEPNGGSDNQRSGWMVVGERPPSKPMQIIQNLHRRAFDERALRAAEPQKPIFPLDAEIDRDESGALDFGPRFDKGEGVGGGRVGAMNTEFPP